MHSLISTASNRPKYHITENIFCVFISRFGRKMTLCVSSILYLGCALGIAWTPSYVVYLVLIFAVGFFSVGNFMPAFVMGKWNTFSMVTCTLLSNHSLNSNLQITYTTSTVVLTETFTLPSNHNVQQQLVLYLLINQPVLYLLITIFISLYFTC